MSSKISGTYGIMKTWSKNKGEDHCFSNSDGQRTTALAEDLLHYAGPYWVKLVDTRT